jgi:predicted lipid-binding transport protein (Tim44 family)
LDGDDAALLEVATPTRLRQIKVTAVDVSHEPATMTIEAELGGRRYVEDRDTAAIVGGSKERPVTFSERWRLALTGEQPVPWRVVDSSVIPGPIRPR